jgi:hypothetical protein
MQKYLPLRPFSSKTGQPPQMQAFWESMKQSDGVLAQKNFSSSFRLQSVNSEQFGQRQRLRFPSLFAGFFMVVA